MDENDAWIDIDPNNLDATPDLPPPKPLNRTIGHKPTAHFLLFGAEHRYLGDALVLPGYDKLDRKTQERTAAKNAFTLPNGLSITYGAINGLAGDFFGTSNPICRGRDIEQKKRYFLDAFNTLAEGEASKHKASKLIEALTREREIIERAVREGRSAYEAYLTEVPDETFQFEAITQALGSGLAYLELAEINLDHFALGAREAYNAGHWLALEAAWNGELERAYMLNAFADHYLEDSFASGHLRVPREELMGGYLTNMCANFMHVEDNYHGLEVWNADKSKTWRAFGDEKLFEPSNNENKDQIFLALNASVGEIYDAYEKSQSGQAPPRYDPTKFPDFAAWKHAPAPDSWTSKENNKAPMFKVIDGVVNRRKIADDLDCWEYEPVVKPFSWWSKSFPHWMLYYVCWGWTAWEFAPHGEAQKVVVSWLRSKKVPDFMLRLAGLMP